MKIRQLKARRSNSRKLAFDLRKELKKLEAKGSMSIFERIRALSSKYRFVVKPFRWNEHQSPFLESIATEHLFSSLSLKNEFVYHVEQSKKRSPEDVNERHYFCKGPLNESQPQKD